MEFHVVPRRDSNPTAVALDSYGNVYIADSANHRGQFFLASQTVGQTVAGVTGIAGNNATLLNLPFSVVLDIQENLYVVDRGNHRVQKFMRSYDVIDSATLLLCLLAFQLSGFIGQQIKMKHLITPKNTNDNCIRFSCRCLISCSLMASNSDSSSSRHVGSLRASILKSIAPRTALTT